MKRRIPVTMATQHPDNARGPFWERGDGFVSVPEEPEECVVCFRDLGVHEYMWDWEGKYADESVIDKLFSNHYEYFRTHLLGKDKFLTFRLPNVWKEKGYSLIRALMVILTSEDFVYDLSFRSRPPFEVILPMTERANQLMYIQKSFQKLAQFKSKVFKHRDNNNLDYIELIPLVEGVKDQIGIRKLLRDYVRLHTKHFRKKPLYIRPFLARSDPALLSGFVANVLANKIALSEIYRFEASAKVRMYPIIGTGSLIFRGGLSPLRAKKFMDEYAGVRTVTVQPAFRYDYPLPRVKKAISYLHAHVAKGTPLPVEGAERATLVRIIGTFAKVYQSTVTAISRDLEPFFRAVPRRRERRQHIGLLAYKRHVGKQSLPRAINFAAACYSLGIPPEFIGLGRALARLKKDEMEILRKYYKYFREDVLEAGCYINRENVRILSKGNKAWRLVLADIELAEDILGVRFGPKTHKELLHTTLSSQLLLQRKNKEEVSRLIAETGKLRGSLG